MDTLIAIVAGMTIFPIVFANNLAINAGPSLIFKTIPVAFSQMPMGRFFCMMFFIMLELAAFTSAFALLEPMVVFLREKMQWSRRKATYFAGLLVWLLSIGSILSFNLAANISFFGKNFFELLDFLTSNIMLPLGGLIVAIFTGWVMYRPDTAEELQLHRHGRLYKIWRFCVRFIAPLFILTIFARSLHLF